MIKWHNTPFEGVETTNDSGDTKYWFNSPFAIIFEASATDVIKSINGIAWSSIKKINGIVKANIKKMGGVSTT